MLAVACSADPTASPTPSSIQPSATPAATGSAAGEPDPGQPYDATAILDAMRTSPRPDGVPTELQTDAIAGSIAGAIWTVDGEPWDRILIGASCGDPACLVEVAGSRDGADADDVWTFSVDPLSGEVSVAADELRAIPRDLVEALDRRVRSLLEETDLAEMVLTAAVWQPPPDADRFELSYRSGGEEGSCGLDVVFDAALGEIVDRRAVGNC
jgi:hypothetical protein